MRGARRRRRGPASAFRHDFATVAPSVADVDPSVPVPRDARVVIVRSGVSVGVVVTPRSEPDRRGDRPAPPAPSPAPSPSPAATAPARDANAGADCATEAGAHAGAEARPAEAADLCRADPAADGGSTRAAKADAAAADGRC